MDRQAPSAPSRRVFLAAGACLAATSACAPSPAPPGLAGRIVGRELWERGHRVRAPFAGGAEPADRADVVIVGAGVAGLAAAWRLARAGPRLAVVVLEVGDRPGGTAASGEDAVSGPHPFGAHYITLPGPAAVHVRAILEDLGVIVGRDADGRPRYDPAALCFAPEERVFDAGTWQEGLWPGDGASAEDERERRDFEEVCREWSARRGADGLRAFEIPVAKSTADPEVRRLAGISFADWLAARGYRSERLRWLCAYACRDDFGAPPEEVSAWAGLHYHCARAPDPGDARDLGTEVLTWPDGNGTLVRGLLSRIPWPITAGAVVRRVEGEPAGDGVRVWYEHGGSTRGVRARRAVLAVPASVADRLVDRPSGDPRPSFAPWRVAQIHCDRLPDASGVRRAWDSVVFGGRGLGFVHNRHQQGYRDGPCVLTYYEPLDGEPPAEARTRLAATPWAEHADLVLSDLAPALHDLRRRVHRIDVLPWGHGTVRPTVGLHTGEALARAAAPWGPIHFAHTDLSGLSLFEEASWHGVRAAEEVLAALGVPAGASLL